MATPTGPGKLIFSNGENCDCVFCAPAESDHQPACECDARPITVTVELVETETRDCCYGYGSLPRERPSVRA